MVCNLAYALYRHMPSSIGPLSDKTFGPDALPVDIRFANIPKTDLNGVQPYLRSLEIIKSISSVNVVAAESRQNWQNAPMTKP